MSAAIFPHHDFEGMITALPRPGVVAWPGLRPVLVPSLTVADCVEARLADRFGVCMGLEFLMPQEFIHRAVGPGLGSPWSKRQLLWKVLPHVAEYAVHLGLKDPSPRDRYALAGLIADRLDQYGHFRPEIIRSWAIGKWAKDNKPLEHEAWQRDLWCRLRSAVPELHPALAMQELRGDACARKRLAQRYPDPLVLGTGALDPLLIEVLQVLSDEGSEVTVHVVLPSLEYLGDLRRTGRLPAEESDMEDIAIRGGHPLLESMGRHAIGAFHLLGQLDEQYTNWPEQGEETQNVSTLLRRVQADVRAIRGPQHAEVSAGDISLRVHSCFGPRREMEVLRDELLRAFDELENLQAFEVHIVTPDLETYAPLVSAVLRLGTPALPVRMSELPAAGCDPVVDAVLALLGIAHRGRFEAAEVLDLIDKQAALDFLQVVDPAGLRRWVRDSGLTHGMGDNGPGSAGFSRNRLLAGRWFAPHSKGSYPDATFVLPVADELGGDPELAERFFDWLASLEAAVVEWNIPVSAKDWANRLNRAGQELFGGPEADVRELAQLTAFLAGQNEVGDLDVGAVLDWVGEECAESGRRSHFAGGIAFGRFKQLQSLPCRVLAMVGMQDANFPARNRAPAWDLLKAAPRIWDRNPRLDDRQLFLDALLTPSERLIVTGSTRNVRTKESEPFSSCVDEVLRVVQAMGGGRPVVEQRLQPFAAEYFHGGGLLPRSYDAFHAEVASRLVSGSRRPGVPFWEGEATNSSSAKVEISVKQLANFWRDPAMAFIKACGILLPREEATDEDFNRAPLALDGLQSWKLKDGIFQEILSGGAVEDYLRASMAADRQLPPGELAGYAYTKAHDLTAPVAASVLRELGKRVQLEWQVTPGILIASEVLLTRGGCELLAYRIGEAKKPVHFLLPWLDALLAAASGKELTTRLFDDNRVETPATLAAIPADVARETLSLLVRYYLEGQTRPLRFAPEASGLIAKIKKKNGDEGTAIQQAEEAWAKDNPRFGLGEGAREPARLAWRDVNPFDETEEWFTLASAVSGPLAQWGGVK